MATVKLASARIDENGNAYGGKAGDQTGKEVSIQNWYLHSKGWYVIRAKTTAIAEKMATAMEAACRNDKIGYDQHQRNTLYTQAAKVDFDPARVTVACETDCSALIRVCAAYAGVMGIPADTRTGNMPTRYAATGEFAVLREDMYCKRADYLRRGDVLVTRTSGHTVMALNDGALAYTINPAKCPYTEPLKAFTAGAKSAGVLWLQWHLDALGYDLGKCGIDGDYGKCTKAAVKAYKGDAKKRGVKGLTPGNYRIAELTRAALIADAKTT